MSTLIVGQHKDISTPPKVELKPQRDIEEYKGEPPTSNDGKNAIIWELKKESCGIKWKAKKCEKHLLVGRVMRTEFEWDTNQAGGQLIYDDKNSKYFKYCPEHGPSPIDGGKWAN